MECREEKVTPHVAQNITTTRGSRIDARLRSNVRAPDGLVRQDRTPLSVASATSAALISSERKAATFMRRGDTTPGRGGFRTAVGAPIDAGAEPGKRERAKKIGLDAGHLPRATRITSPSKTSSSAANSTCTAVGTSSLGLIGV